jgi:hypothetical protein
VRLLALANVFQFSRPLPPDDRMEGSGKQEPRRGRRSWRGQGRRRREEKWERWDEEGLALNANRAR